MLYGVHAVPAVQANNKALSILCYRKGREGREGGAVWLDRYVVCRYPSTPFVEVNI